MCNCDSLKFTVFCLEYRVMVLDTGTIREFDSPSQLLANKGSLFYALAKDAGVVKDQ